MRQGTTERVEDQAVLGGEGLEEAIRERVREVIEEILHEEVEEAWARGEASAPWDVAATGMEGSIAG